VIVADEPHPAGVRPDPSAKVDYFLDQSDAMVALCTPDDQLQDRTVQPRQNIISDSNPDRLDAMQLEPSLSVADVALHAVHLRQHWLDVAWCRLVPGVLGSRLGSQETH
jgi:hypothetical protein